MLVVLVGLALAAGPGAQATTTPSDEGGSVEEVEPVVEEPAPEDGAPADGEEHAEPAPEPEPTGLRMVGGFVANGHSAGPTTFEPVLGDATYPVPEPPVNENLPQELDVLGSYQRKVSCDPQDRPGITAFAMLVFDHYGRPGYSGSRPCIDYNSFHHDGRALDWALSAYDPMDRRIADSTIVWLTENDGEMATRFGIQNIIWNFKIWDKAGGWQHYVGAPHDDHVHFAFTWDGAQAQTSWWTGVAVSEPDLGPCAPPEGLSSPMVFQRLEGCDPVTGLATAIDRPEGGLAMVQEMLGLEVTGTLDEPTRAGLIAWQMANELPVTGMADVWTTAAIGGLDPVEMSEELQAALPRAWELTEFTPYLRTTLTQGAVGPAVELLQTAIGATPDGDFGPKTAAALREWEESDPLLTAQLKRRGADAPAEVTPLTWMLLERQTHPTIELRDIELSEGSIDQVGDPEGTRAAQALDGQAEGEGYAGGAVTVLQKLLDVEVDGIFGPMTGEAVQAVQEAAGLEPTGVVDGPTWVAIEAAAIEAELVPGAPGLAAQREREKAEAEEAAAKAAAEEKARQEAAEDAAFEESLADADR